LFRCFAILPSFSLAASTLCIAVKNGNYSDEALREKEAEFGLVKSTRAAG